MFKHVLPSQAKYYFIHKARQLHIIISYTCTILDEKLKTVINFNQIYQPKMFLYNADILKALADRV